MFGSKTGMVLAAALLTMGLTLTGCNRNEPARTGTQDTRPSGSTTDTGAPAGGTTSTPSTGTTGQTGDASRPGGTGSGAVRTETGTRPESGTPTTAPEGTQTR
ncbi:MAG TPA: hypothetical protein VEK08_26490 [Planctomycetota bacterium]|nr:hypothetical protein [Planctomycetota bacterium]